MKTQSDENLLIAKELVEGSEKQVDAFKHMFQEAVNSYMELMNAPYDLYQKNLEAFGGGSRKK
ncbi:hypothetical protein BH23ACT11_BH23ACT11_26210 [soil metagenome]